jgi:hypothetical protein
MKRYFAWPCSILLDHQVAAPRERTAARRQAPALLSNELLKNAQAMGIVADSILSKITLAIDFSEYQFSPSILGDL